MSWVRTSISNRFHTASFVRRRLNRLGMEDGCFAIYFNGPTFKGPNDTPAASSGNEKIARAELGYRSSGDRMLPGHLSVFLSCSQTFFSDQSDRGVIYEVRMEFEKTDQVNGIATEFSRDKESIGG